LDATIVDCGVRQIRLTLKPDATIVDCGVRL